MEKELIEDHSRQIPILLEIIERSKKRIETYREILEDPNLTKDPSHSNFRQCEELKQQAYHQIGETKYLIHTCEQDLVSIRRRIKMYRSLMIPYIS